MGGNILASRDALGIEALETGMWASMDSLSSFWQLAHVCGHADWEARLQALLVGKTLGDSLLLDEGMNSQTKMLEALLSAEGWQFGWESLGPLEFSLQRSRGSAAAER